MTKEALILTVTRAQQGDPRAFDVLVRQYQNTAVAYARTLLRDPAAAEDAAQEAFVQAWRDLPRLTEAAAFSAWLRRIVFKFCDRVRRSSHPTLPLDETVPLPSFQEPAPLVERTDEAVRIRAAIEALPCLLREVTLLYYLTGHAVQEIADFLDIPASTVKNRLRASRKRLRKELWTMAEMILENEKPSQDETFAENVLARVLREFQQQEAVDPQSADRGLLEEGRTALFQILSQAVPLNRQSIRDGFLLLRRKQDWQSLSVLLMRYLAQPLSDSETAWAYLHLANAIAMSGSAAGSVLVHEAFECWIPGKSPFLSTDWPFYPVPEEGSEPVYSRDEIRLLFLAQATELSPSFREIWFDQESVEFMTSFLKAWCSRDFLAKVDAILSELPIRPGSRRLRFSVLRKAANTCVTVGDLDDTGRYVQQMHDAAEQAEDEAVRAELKAQALGQEIHLAQRRQDETTFAARAAEMASLLDATAGTQEADLRWIRTERQSLAIVLMRGKRHDLALPLWEANAENGGQVNGWGWLLYAATVWQMTRDREHTATLLREACASDDRDLISKFVERPEFAGVRDDTEFLQAIGRKFAVR